MKRHSLPRLRFPRLLTDSGRPSRFTVWTVGIAVVYLLLVGLILPHALRPVLEKQMSQALGTPCRVEALSCNPFTLKVTAEHIAVPYPDGAGMFLRLGRLEITPSFTSLFRLAPGLKELKLVDPAVDVTLFANGLLSPELFLAANGDEVSPEAEQKDSPLFPFIVYDFSVSNGTLTFRDQVRNATNVVENINLVVPFASTLAADKEVAVTPSLNATVQGRSLVFAGETRPFDSSLRTEFRLVTDMLDLAHFREYIGPYTNLELHSGSLLASLTLRLEREPDKSLELALAGRAEIAGLELKGPHGTAFKAARAGVDLDNVLIGPRRIVVNDVFLDSPAITVRRQVDGSLDWQGFFKETRPAPPSAPPLALAAGSGTALRPANATLHAANATVSGRNASLRAANATTAAANATMRSHNAAARPANATAHAAAAMHAANATTPAGNGTVSASAGTLANGASGHVPQPPALALIIAKASINKGSVVWHDASVPGFGAYTLSNINVSFADVSSEGEGKADFTLAFGEGAGTFTATGKAALEPMRVEGKVTLESLDMAPFSRYLVQAAGLSLDSAHLGLNGDFFAQYGGKFQAHFNPGEFSLSNLSVSIAGVKEPLVAVKRLAVADLTADMSAKHIAVGKVTGTGLALRPVRGKNGEIVLPGQTDAQRVATPPPVPKALPKTAAKAHAAQTTAGKQAAGSSPARPQAAPPAAPPSSPWQLTLNSLALDAGSVVLTDNSMQTQAVLPLSDIKLNLANLSTQADKQWTATFAARPGKRGTLNLNAKGSLNPLQVAFQFKADKADLAFLSPYINEAADLTLAEASLGADISGEVKPARTGEMDIQVQGDAGLYGISLHEKGKEFAGWGRLRAEKFRYQSAAKSTGTLSMGALTLNSPRLSVIMDKNGGNSVQRVLRQPLPKPAPEASQSAPKDAPQPVKEAEKQGSAIPKAAGAAEEPVAEPVGGFSSLSIGSVAVSEGQFTLRDERMQPPFVLKLDKLQLDLKHLSADPASRGELTGALRLNGSPVTFSGDLNPLVTVPVGKVKVDIKALDLSMFSQYAAKFIGYPIQNGAITAKINGSLVGPKLDIQNELLISKLELGAKDTTPGAPDMPVKLAISLISDLNGDISLSLPVSGSLDDPHFRIGGIIGKVIANIMLKAVTSPFSLLGGIVGGTINLLSGGGGPDLERIAFAPGEDRLDERALASLSTLGKALAKRPSIKLELTGVADMLEKGDIAEADVLKAMRRIKYDRLPRAEKAATTPDQMNVGPDVNADEYADLLFNVYAAAPFAKPESSPGKPMPQSTREMMRQLRNNAKIADNRVQALAQSRAQAVRDALVKADASLAGRVSISAPEVSPEGPDRKVDAYVRTKMK